MIVVDQRSETFYWLCPGSVCIFYLCFCIRVTQDSDMQFLRLSVGAVSPWEEVMLKYQVLSQMQGVLLNAILAVFTFPVGKGFADEWCPVFFPHSHTFFSCFVFPQSEFHTVTLFLMCSFLHLFCSTPASLLLYTQRKHSQTFKYECSNLPSVLI